MSGLLPLFHLSSLFRHDYYCSTGFFHPIGPRHVLVPLPFLYFQVQTIYLFNNFLKLFYTSFHLLFNIHNFLFTTLLFFFLQYLGFSTTKYGYKYMSVYFFNMTLHYSCLTVFIALQRCALCYLTSVWLTELLGFGACPVVPCSVSPSQCFPIDSSLWLPACPVLRSAVTPSPVLGQFLTTACDCMDTPQIACVERLPSSHALRGH